MKVLFRRYNYTTCTKYNLIMVSYEVDVVCQICMGRMNNSKMVIVCLLLPYPSGAIIKQQRNLWILAPCS